MSIIPRRSFVQKLALLGAAAGWGLRTRLPGMTPGQEGTGLNLLVEDGALTFLGRELLLTRCQPALVVDGRAIELVLTTDNRVNTTTSISWRGGEMELLQVYEQESDLRWRVKSRLRNLSARVRVLNKVALLQTPFVVIGRAAEEVRILEQNFYTGRVRTLGDMATGRDDATALDGSGVSAAFVSDTVTLLFSPADRMGLLIGYETCGRWRGRIKGRVNSAIQGTAPSPGPAADAKVSALECLTAEFHGGGLPLNPEEDVPLEELMLETGDNPEVLLGGFASRVAERNHFPRPPDPFVNWNSWYPFRLAVSHQKIVEQARKAKERSLDRLGLRFMEADLGWQKDNIPTFFEANHRFPGGLAGLSRDLESMGLKLGGWCGAVCVAASHPVAQVHPEWLLKKEAGDQVPHSYGSWPWEPRPAMYALDVTHPDARAWLRDEIRKMAQAGVRYFKWDFAGKVTDPALTGRHDPRMITDGLEGLRKIMREAQDSLREGAGGEEVIMLDCGGVDMGGTGIAALNYCVMDTGNTGFQTTRQLRECYTSFASHMFKRRWALLQPSCLVLGLPGTLNEARMRATATFLGAGHVDLGDDLVTLPEERWDVLLATLPQNRIPPRIVDQWDPIALSEVPDLKDSATDAPLFATPTPGKSDGASVWTVRTPGGWDDWTLVGIFNWSEPTLKNGMRLARRYQIELSKLGYAATDSLWAYEFWSGQFLGEIPQGAASPGAYLHKGDVARLVVPSGPGWLDVAFHGPAVKLLVLRKPRAHPWPIATTFHQSGGLELSEVKWTARTRTLQGILHRPAGESGFVIVAMPAHGDKPLEVRRIPVSATGDKTAWQARL